MGSNPLAGRALSCSGVLPQSNDVQVRLNAYSKLTVGVNVSMNGCQPCDKVGGMDGQKKKCLL